MVISSNGYYIIIFSNRKISNTTNEKNDTADRYYGERKEVTFEQIKVIYQLHKHVLFTFPLKQHMLLQVHTYISNMSKTKSLPPSFPKLSLSLIRKMVPTSTQ